MGKGKGEVEYWAAVVKPGTILYELGGVSEEQARAAFARVAYKMPVACRFVDPSANALNQPAFRDGSCGRPAARQTVG